MNRSDFPSAQSSLYFSSCTVPNVGFAMTHGFHYFPFHYFPKKKRFTKKANDKRWQYLILFYVRITCMKNGAYRDDSRRIRPKILNKKLKISTITGNIESFWKCSGKYFRLFFNSYTLQFLIKLFFDGLLCNYKKKTNNCCHSVCIYLDAIWTVTGISIRGDWLKKLSWPPYISTYLHRRINNWRAVALARSWSSPNNQYPLTFVYRIHREP